MMLSDLPDDCIREILHKMNDHRSLVETGKTNTRNNELTEDR